jgi:hypothetical protein
MEKIVRTYSSFEAAERADDERYDAMSGTEKLAMLLELIMPENPDEAIIQRSARVYPLVESRRG